MSEIESKLLGFSRRVRWMRAWRGLAVGGVIGCLISLVMASLDLFRVQYFDWPWLLVPIAAGVAVGAIVGGARKVAASSLADSIDRRAGLANRLGTAAEEPATFHDELQQDAIRHLAGLKPAAVYPMRVSKWHTGVVVGMLLVASLFLLGNTPIFMSDAQKRDREELKKIGQTVERVAKPLLDRKPEDLSPEAKELAKKYEQFSKELQKGRMPKEEALQKANDLAKEAERVAKEQFDESDRALGKAQDALEKAAMDKAMRESGLDPSQFDEAERAAIDRGAQMSDDERNSELSKMGSELEALERQLASEKNEKGEALSSEAKEALKSKIAALKKNMKALALSKKVKDMLERLMAQPEFKEIMKMLQELHKKNAEGKNGEMQNPELDEQQIKEIMEKLEQLADRLKDDKEMKAFLEKLKEALKNAKQCSGGG